MLATQLIASCVQDLVLPPANQWIFQDWPGLNKAAAMYTASARPNAGLANLGNSCFFNATLQCLAATPLMQAWAAHVLHAPPQVAGRTAPVVSILAKTLRDMARQSSRRVVPSQLFQNLRRLNRLFHPGRQEDSHEFLRCLLDAAAKAEALGVGVPENAPGRRGSTTDLHYIFGGWYRSQVACPSCQYESNTFEPFLDLSLEVSKRTRSVQDALQALAKAEQLDDSNRWKCDGCGKRVRAVRQMTVRSAPNVLTVQLKRFAFGGLGGYGRFSGGGGRKVAQHIEFPEVLDLSPALSDVAPGGAAARYRLCGVLVHAGSSAQSGHYYSFVRVGSAGWVCADDDSVSRASLRMVREQQAYILFYCREQVLTPMQALGLERIPAAASSAAGGAQQAGPAQASSPSLGAQAQTMALPAATTAGAVQRDLADALQTAAAAKAKLAKKQELLAAALAKRQADRVAMLQGKVELWRGKVKAAAQEVAGLEQALAELQTGHGASPSNKPTLVAAALPVAPKTAEIATPSPASTTTMLHTGDIPRLGGSALAEFTLQAVGSSAAASSTADPGAATLESIHATDKLASLASAWAAKQASAAASSTASSLEPGAEPHAQQPQAGQKRRRSLVVLPNRDALQSGSGSKSATSSASSTTTTSSSSGSSSTGSRSSDDEDEPAHTGQALERVEVSWRALQKPGENKLQALTAGAARSVWADSWDMPGQVDAEASPERPAHTATMTATSQSARYDAVDYALDSGRTKKVRAKGDEAGAAARAEATSAAFQAEHEARTAARHKGAATSLKKRQRHQHAGEPGIGPATPGGGAGTPGKFVSRPKKHGKHFKRRMSR